jgi:hypothetical protein
MQREDGQIIDAEYKTRWNPAKVDSLEIARCCAVEHIFKNGFYADGKPKQTIGHVGLTAVLRAA